MKSDIRIINEDIDGEVVEHIKRVVYTDDGEIVAAVFFTLNELVGMNGGAMAAIDELYRATLKPVLFKIGEGEYL